MVCLAFAAVSWTAVFGLGLINFWLGLGGAASVLAALSVFWGGAPFSRKEITVRNTLWGIAGAVALYAIFAMGRYVSLHILPFAGEQIGLIYTIRHEAHPTLIALVLLCITSPAEEIFWRGFLLRWSAGRFGAFRGWILASGLYMLVHLASGNFMLLGAALVAGLFWGLMYLGLKSLYPCIISHALWTVGIFLLFPMS